MRVRIDLTGQRFGSLQALTVAGKGVTWKCLCDCGATVEHLAARLRAGRVKSCGCQKKTLCAASGVKGRRIQLGKDKT